MPRYHGTLDKILSRVGGAKLLKRWGVSFINKTVIFEIIVAFIDNLALLIVHHP